MNINGLSRGLNFAPAPKCIPKDELIAGTEAALRYLPGKTAAESARAAIADIIRTAQPTTSNIIANERRALSGLKGKETLIIAKADKGNAVVLFDTTDCIEKATDLLFKSPFQRIKGEPTMQNEKIVNNTLKDLLKEKKD